MSARISLFLVTAIALLLMSGCSSIQSHQSGPLDTQTKWVLLPLINLSQTPLAAERAESILASHLRATPLDSLTVYPAQVDDNAFGLRDDQQRFETAKQWAKTQSAHYWITGTITEWQYKAGLDGEPAVGLSLQIIDTQSNQVIWTASGARTGWGREGIAAAMNTLVDELLSELTLD